MAYKELIKDFGRIRDYMRAFYIYGFMHREEFDAKSARSYDNERRRIESWLGEYVSFRQDEDGKAVFLSVASRDVAGNPLYKAFKAKTFTANDIMLHFYLMDILDEQTMSVKEIIDCITEEYLDELELDWTNDESTVRKKLNEYVSLGIIDKKKCGREVVYTRAAQDIDLENWKEAVAFFSETAPVGVVGSYVLDQLNSVPDHYRFKHHYMLHALDSEILCKLLWCMGEQTSVRLQLKGGTDSGLHSSVAYPFKIYVSTQTGRQYLLAYVYNREEFKFFRLDNVISCETDDFKGNPDVCRALYEKEKDHLWGVSYGDHETLDHLEMVIRMEDHEYFIAERLQREKRSGRLEKMDANLWRYSIDVFDAMEMMPWIRTFIGRIVEFHCSDARVEERFYDGICEMCRMYGQKDR